MEHDVIDALGTVGDGAHDEFDANRVSFAVVVDLVLNEGVLFLWRLRFRAHGLILQAAAQSGQP